MLTSHLNIFLCEVSAQIFSLFLFLFVSYDGLLSMFWIQVHYQIYVSWIFSPILSLYYLFSFLIYLFIFGCIGSSLVCGLSVVAASRGHSSGFFWSNSPLSYWEKQAKVSHYDHGLKFFSLYFCEILLYIFWGYVNRGKIFCNIIPSWWITTSVTVKWSSISVMFFNIFMIHHFCLFIFNLFVSLYFILFFILFILFLAVLCLCCCSQAFSSCSERGFLLLRSTGSRCLGFSSCGSRALEHRLSSCGTWTLLLHGMWDLPGPGLEPMSPALAGGFLTTVPPGKSLYYLFS